ncbi:Zn-ribbon domain-containing OB-fold protein [Actinophytocola sp.]|jgi:hypothetical protein|uniref:Zn-ribbon domain-containing OB-fold protein n=1 Tax=Actinophytocola sp. TaxID=1872138 RepID=UPI002ED8EF1D
MDVRRVDLAKVLAVTPFPQRPRLDHEAGRLVGTRCGNCGAVSWPGRPVCQRCGAVDAREIALSDEGTLITYTTVWVRRPGLPTPYVLGQVDLADGVRIFAHGRGLTEEHRVPLPVRLVLLDDPDAVPPFVFEPRENR